VTSVLFPLPKVQYGRLPGRCILSVTHMSTEGHAMQIGQRSRAVTSGAVFTPVSMGCD